MNLPGFTAEDSIYHTGRSYRQLSGTRTTSAGRLLPQLRPVCTKCIWDTYDYGVPTCAKLCRYPAPPRATATRRVPSGMRSQRVSIAQLLPCGLCAMLAKVAVP